MSILKPNGNGKAATAEKQLSENFFNQCFVTPNPIDQRQVMIHPLPGSGIPMRDYFAAQALSWACANQNVDSSREVAEWAYRVADAMMEARKAKQDANGFPYEDGKL